MFPVSHKSMELYSKYQFSIHENAFDDVVRKM